MVNSVIALRIIYKLSRRRSRQISPGHPTMNLTSSIILVLALCAVRATALKSETIDSAFISNGIIQQDPLKYRLTTLVRLGFDQLENGDPELARRTFEQALEIGDTDPRVHLGLGRCYLNRRDRRITLFQIIERIFDKDFISRAIDSFKKAEGLAPDWWEVHYWLGCAYMRRYDPGDARLALEQMERAYRQGGLRRDIHLKLAVLLKVSGDLENAEEILRRAEAERGAAGDPLADLELAKISLSRGRLNDCLHHYWLGVKEITTREQMGIFFNELAVIASEAEHKQFQRLNSRDAEKFFRSIWYSRDHDLNLTPGVRLIQHFSRLQEADSLYRVPFRSRSPGISVMMAYVPPENIPYDDRGIIFIHHGQPSRVITHRGEGLYPNETWVYYRDEGDLILNFVALKGNYEYQLVSSLTAAVMNYRGLYSTVSAGPEENYRLHWMTELYSSRLEIGDGIYARMMNNPYDPFVHLEEYEQNILSIQTALGTESVPEPYTERLESYYDLVEFRGESEDKSAIEFYSGVPGKEISFTNGSGRYNYEIKSQLGIYDRDWNQVEWLEQLDRHSSTISPRELENREVVGIGRVDLPPGDYYYFVRIQNGASLGNFNGRLTVDSYGKDSLQTSQILTARNIYTALADSSKFKRYGLEIEPHPSRTFHPSEKMFAYQEIYNLTPDQEGNYNYRVTYSMALIQRDRNVFGKIYDSFKMMMGAGPGQEHVVLTFDKKRAPVDQRMVQEDVAIDLTDNYNGLYELSIRVEDLNNGGHSFNRNTRFFVRR